jgi:hypothetical protein
MFSEIWPDLRYRARALLHPHGSTNECAAHFSSVIPISGDRSTPASLVCAARSAPRGATSRTWYSAKPLRVASIGVAIGLPAGVAATRLIRAQVFGVGTLDMVSIAIAILALTVAAVVASYLTARRAARVSALEALRSD